MKSVLALEDLIKQNEERIALQKRLLSDHESGVNKLSAMILASTENNLEKAIQDLQKYKAMLEELLEQDQTELEEKERLEEAIKRKKYFENQYMRVKDSNERSNDQKIEAMMILDELSSDVQFEDNELFDIAIKSLELNITNHQELYDKLTDIREQFNDMLGKIDDRDISDLATFNEQIPIVVLQFSILLTNIKENLEEDRKAFQKKVQKRLDEERIKNNGAEVEKTPEEIEKENSFDFSGFPKFQDWWIDELWHSHQAYFALYKWKSMISNLCKTTPQKRSWSLIFDNWLCIKKAINAKGEMAFEYNFVFDTLIRVYAEFEEELNKDNLLSMESIIKQITKKENFLTFHDDHTVETPYLLFKRAKYQS